MKFIINTGFFCKTGHFFKCTLKTVLSLLLFTPNVSLILLIVTSPIPAIYIYYLFVYLLMFTYTFTLRNEGFFRSPSPAINTLCFLIYLSFFISLSFPFPSPTSFSHITFLKIEGVKTPLDHQDFQNFIFTYVYPKISEEYPLLMTMLFKYFDRRVKKSFLCSVRTIRRVYGLRAALT